MHLTEAAAVGQHALVGVEVIQRAAAAKHHAGLRVIRHAAGNVQLVVDGLGQSGQGGRAASEDDAVLEDIAGQLGRGALNDALNGFHQIGHSILEGLVISVEETVMVLGNPESRSRPVTSSVRGVRGGIAVPRVILTSSALRSPMSRLCFLRR